MCIYSLQVRTCLGGESVQRMKKIVFDNRCVQSVADS